MKYWYMLQHGWTLKAFLVKEIRYKRPHIVGFHVHEMSKIGKFIEMESIFCCSQEMGGERNGEW